MNDKVNKSTLGPWQTLAAGRLIFSNKLPYFEAATLVLASIEAKGLGTLGVTEHGVLMIDFDWLVTNSIQEVGGLYAHETMHVVRNTPERTRRLVGFDPSTITRAMLSEEQRHLLKLSNWGADMAINWDLKQAGFELPKDGIFAEAFGFPGGLTHEQYYYMLVEWEKKFKKRISNKGPCCAGGFCGSGGGQANDGEPLGGSNLNRTLTEMQQMRQACAESIQSAVGRGRGDIPNGLRVWAGEVTAPPQIPWHKKLSRACRQAVATRAGAVDLRYDGPSRRQGVMGWGIGAPILPRFRAPIPTIWLVEDTSGSMQEADHEIALTEFNGVVKSVNEIVFIAIDAAIHSRVKARNWRDMKKAVRGGGGTNFASLFEELRRTKNRPSVVIFATDGDASGVPAEAPIGIKFIWLLPQVHHRPPVSWGEVIHIQPVTGKVA